MGSQAKLREVFAALSSGCESFVLESGGLNVALAGLDLQVSLEDQTSQCSNLDLSEGRHLFFKDFENLAVALGFLFSDEAGADEPEETRSPIDATVDNASSGGELASLDATSASDAAAIGIELMGQSSAEKERLGTSLAAGCQSEETQAVASASRPASTSIALLGQSLAPIEDMPVSVGTDSGGPENGAVVPHVESTFSPEIAIEDLPEKEKARASVVYSSVRNEHISSMSLRCHSEFKSFLQTLPSFCRAVVGQEVRSRWLMNHYVDIVAGVVDERTYAYSFSPEITPLELSPEEREKAEALCRKTTLAHAAEIQRRANEAFNSVWCSMPAGLGFDAGVVRKAWCLENYFDIVESVVGHTSRLGLSFEPAIPVSSLPEHKQSAAQSLVDRIPPALMSPLQELLRSSCEKEWSQIPSACVIKFEKFQERWQQEKYFDELERLLPIVVE